MAIQSAWHRTHCDVCDKPRSCQTFSIGYDEFIDVCFICQKTAEREQRKDAKREMESAEELGECDRCGRIEVLAQVDGRGPDDYQELCEFCIQADCVPDPDDLD